jgi:ankyrin repeat protein
MTALHWAAFNDDMESVKLLLDFGAKSTLNKKKLTPVDIAARCLNVDVIEIFIKDMQNRIDKEAEHRRPRQHTNSSQKYNPS